VNKTTKNLLVALLGVITSATAKGESGHQGHGMAKHRHVGNEPIGVMGAHAHEQGDWMISYRFMRMDMDGNRDGTDRLSSSEVLADYMIAPTSMTMDMHMFGAMYGVNDNITVMAMVPYVRNEMDHVTRMGGEFTTKTSGLGDIKLSGLFNISRWGMHELDFNLGLSMPTGSIDEKDDTPAGDNQHLPYPMQLGSGTWDLIPGLTYLGHNDKLDWGAQAIYVWRLGENDNDYTLGDRFHLTGWLAKDWTPQWSTSLRADAQWWDNIDGSDKKLPPMAPMVVPTADPELRGGRRLDLLLGVSFAPASGWFEGQRFAAEIGAPVYQNLDGPQLETDWIATLGWQIFF
jgi:hypothetical protein